MEVDGSTQNTGNGDGGNGGGDGSQSLGWKTELPEALRGHEAFAAYGSKAELYKGVAEMHATHKETLQKLTDTEGRINTDYIPKLKADATPEQKAAYRAALGVPESADKYELAKPADWPDDMPWDDTITNAFKTVAHNLGIPAEQAKGLFGWYNGLVKEMITAQAQTDKETTEKAVNELKTEWGDKYEGNVAVAKRVYDKLLETEAEKKWFLAQDDPMLQRLLLRAAPAFLNDTDMGGSQAGGQADLAKEWFPNSPGMHKT